MRGFSKVLPFLRCLVQGGLVVSLCGNTIGVVEVARNWKGFLTGPNRFI